MPPSYRLYWRVRQLVTGPAAEGPGPTAITNNPFAGLSSSIMISIASYLINIKLPLPKYAISTFTFQGVLLIRDLSWWMSVFSRSYTEKNISSFDEPNNYFFFIYARPRIYFPCRRKLYDHFHWNKPSHVSNTSSYKCTFYWIQIYLSFSVYCLSRNIVVLFNGWSQNLLNFIKNLLEIFTKI